MASGFTDLTNENLLRTQVWSKSIKQLCLDDLFATKFVRVLTDFPDGSLINIPSIGEAETADFNEGAAIKYNKMDTGNYQFQFDQYKYSANAISEKFKRDSFYSNDVIAAFVPREHRAIMEAVEARILSRGPAGQTLNDPNVINTANHRSIGAGANQSLALQDFSKAWFALKKANMPMTNLVAIVDPTVAYTLQTQTNMVNLITPSMKWASVVNSGLVTGMQFQFNIYGFDVYVSNYLPVIASETISGATITNAVANQFFSAAPGDTLPIIGGFRQQPTVYTEFNKDLQQNEYLTIAEYGFQLYRPENMVVVLTALSGVIV